MRRMHCVRRPGTGCRGRRGPRLRSSRRRPGAVGNWLQPAQAPSTQSPAGRASGGRACTRRPPSLSGSLTPCIAVACAAGCHKLQRARHTTPNRLGACKSQTHTCCPCRRLHALFAGGTARTVLGVLGPSIPYAQGCGAQRVCGRHHNAAQHGVHSMAQRARRTSPHCVRLPACFLSLPHFPSLVHPSPSILDIPHCSPLAQPWRWQPNPSDCPSWTRGLQPRPRPR